MAIVTNRANKLIKLLVNHPELIDFALQLLTEEGSPFVADPLIEETAG